MYQGRELTKSPQTVKSLLYLVAVKGPNQSQVNTNKMIPEKLGKMQSLVLFNQKIPE